ncbi:MAG: hypothetical protein KDE27_21710 [Planctomycetes bacterium]|nr:hypothetical protein [Planctomycetota bacterium]
MPSSLTYPGVYVEEIPSGVRTITGVATSITAFVGWFPRGPLDEAVRIFSFGEFERHFDGLDSGSDASYAVQQFFLNGGSEAYIVRVASKSSPPVSSSVDLPGSPSGSSFTVQAANEGEWGDEIRVTVDYDTPSPTSTFNMTVTREQTDDSGRRIVIASEQYSNLSITDSLPDIIEGKSLLVRVDPTTITGANRPQPTGTVSGDIAGAIGTTLPSTPQQVTVTTTVGGPSGSGTPHSYTITIDMSQVSRTSQLATAFQNALRAIARDPDDTFDLSRATAKVIGDPSTEQYLTIRAGNDADTVAFADDGGSLVTDLGLTANGQAYVLDNGDDGPLPGATDITGSDGENRDGIYALRDVDLFNILCIPDTMRLGDTEAGLVFAAATNLCIDERAFYILDIPQPASNPREEVSEITEWLGNNSALRNPNVALYYPRPRVADPNNDYLLRSVAPSGTAAGLYARTDTARGIWKAPAGTDAVLRGVAELEYKLTDAENGVVNPLAINAFRNLPVYGRVAWGARTLAGADAAASEWKYVPVRRTALFIEESLFRGLQWVVFEPNDEPLWASIRLNVSTFMQQLFRQGAFQGASPSEAYLVKCDAETTTQADIDSGIVNILVGFAPLKPAEFVVLKLQQLTSQAEA